MNIGNKPPDDTKAKPGEDKTGYKVDEDIAPLHVNHGGEDILHQSPVLVTDSVQFSIAISSLGYYPSPISLLQILSILYHFVIFIVLLSPLCTLWWVWRQIFPMVELLSQIPRILGSIDFTKKVTNPKICIVNM